MKIIHLFFIWRYKRKHLLLFIFFFFDFFAVTVIGPDLPLFRFARFVQSLKSLWRISQERLFQSWIFHSLLLLIFYSTQVFDSPLEQIFWMSEKSIFTRFFPGSVGLLANQTIIVIKNTCLLISAIDLRIDLKILKYRSSTSKLSLKILF